MKSNYPKSILLVLILLLQTITLNLIAQQENFDSATNFKGMKVSEKEGILAKLSVNNKNIDNNDTTPFYLNALLNKKYGLNSHSGLSQKSSSYVYHEHNIIGANIPMSAVTDNLGNTFITGATSTSNSPEGNYVAIKIDHNGNQVWETILPGTPYTYEIGIASGLDANGNYITTGLHWNGDNTDIKTVKFNGTSGAIIWESIFNNTNNTLDVPTALHVDQNGNTVIAGIAFTNNAINFVTLLYDSNGNLLWSAIDNTSQTNTWNEPKAVTSDANGNVYVTGFSTIQTSGQDFWLGYKTLKYNSSGLLQWQETYVFERLYDESDPNSGMIYTDSMPQSIAVDGNGNCYVTGTFDMFEYSRVGTLKYDTSGNEEWVETYRGGASNTNFTNGHDIIFVDSNKIYVGGRHRSGWSDEGIILISYDDTGNRNWADESINSINISSSTLTIDSNNQPIIAGLGYDEFTYDQRIRVFKYSDIGNILNETSYFKPESDTESIMQLVHLGLDLTDNAYLVMNNFYSITGDVFETVKMNLNSGHNNTDWEVTYGNLNASATQMLSSSRDSNDNTYIAGRYGYVVNNEFIGTFTLTKYNSQGLIEWEKEFNEYNDYESNGIVTRVNSMDEIIVFLLPNPLELSEKLKVLKFNAAGNLVWDFEKTLHNADLKTFFLDNDDNIYISGSAKEQLQDFFPIFFTIKLSNSGNELWSDYATTNNPNDTHYEINSGIVNSQGDIILTGACGQVTMFSPEFDLTVLKYTSSGNLEWLNIYPQTDYISSGIDLVSDKNDNTFITGVQIEFTNYSQQVLIIKIDEYGDELWSTVYSQPNWLLRPYKILQDNNKDLIIVSSSTYWVLGHNTDNKINTLKINKNNGDILWNNDTDINRYYADSYIDADDIVYIYNQVQSSALPHRTGMRIEGGLFQISSTGSTSEEIFTAPELAWFFPASITPLNNGTLLLGGEISQEIRFFSGYYFFESYHSPLNIQDHQQSEIKNENWLGQNYPNPALNTTTIPFYIKHNDYVQINLYDNQGRFLFEIKNEIYSKGYNTIQLDCSDLIPGIYFYQIQVGNYKNARKLIVK